jgi:hypothetical protein
LFGEEHENIPNSNQCSDSNLPAYSEESSNNYLSNVAVDELEFDQRRGMQPRHLREHNYSQQPSNAPGNVRNQSQQAFSHNTFSAEEGDDEYEDPDYTPNRWYFNFFHSFFSRARARIAAAAAAAARAAAAAAARAVLSIKR